MFDSPSSITSGRSGQSHGNEAVAEILRAAAHRRKRSAGLLAVTGQLLADARELLDRCDTAMNRIRYPARRRPSRSTAGQRKPPRGGPRP